MKSVKIDIQARDYPLTDAIQAHIERRLNFALAHGRKSVQRILVTLSDTNGDRGGKDKRCRIQVFLRRLSVVVIQDVEADLYVAIDRAADRAKQTLLRRLKKQQRKQRLLNPMSQLEPGLA